MAPTVVGLFVGLVLGIVVVFAGFAEMLVVAFFGALGYVVMKVVEGEVDLNQYLGGRGRSGP
ncbi:MAG: DUF2273 domain-containing protein [Actinomycetota bacterium]|jgi:uncharacterized membrane protein|nr:DUF2273 domain-containing protein [Actinomycetota bacterium]